MKTLLFIIFLMVTENLYAQDEAVVVKTKETIILLNDGTWINKPYIDPIFSNPISIQQLSSSEMHSKSETDCSFFAKNSQLIRPILQTFDNENSGIMKIDGKIVNFDHSTLDASERLLFVYSNNKYTLYLTIEANRKKAKKARLVVKRDSFFTIFDLIADCKFDGPGS